MNSNIGDQFWKRHQHRERDTNPVLDERHLLEQRIDKLMLITRALWELLQQESKLEEHHLVAKLAEIDLRDGDLDHQLRQPVLDCPNCGRKLNAHNRHCIYCGFQDFPHDAFDLI